jgi:2'-5' RNA ligase
VSATDSAVIVAVAQAEPVVATFRAQFDPLAAWGVPAHVTVLYPFMPPSLIDEQVRDEVAEAVASVPAFEVTFAQTAWFADTVLWLVPEPDQPFRELTAAVWARFPGHAPYRGTYADPIPHLTIGDGAPIELLHAAERVIAEQLPIRARVTCAQLIQGSAQPASWHTVANLPLRLA